MSVPESSSSNRPPEFEPPLASVSRVIKSVLPDNILMTKDARAAFVRAAGIFIFYLTHCSNDIAKENKRQTIFTVDVLNALKYRILRPIL
jgi:DNA polymerase epsilon subunit 3